MEGLELVVQGGVGRGAETGALADLGAEQFGEPVFEASDVLFEAAGAVAEVGVVGQQRPAADGASPGRAAGGGVFGGGDDGGAEVGVAVDERPVDAGTGGDRGWAGRIENCQVGVFLAYCAPDGARALIDRDRRRAARIGEDGLRRQP